MRVAVIGSGVTGLAATWLLNEYSEHEVHIYEADDRPGGHASTAHVTQPGKEPADVDTAFVSVQCPEPLAYSTYLYWHRPNHLTARLSQIVFNPPMYPNFRRFLELHKRTGDVIENDMTFSVSSDGGAFEWAGDSLRNLLCKPSTIFDLSMWRMVFDVARFNLSAVRVLSEDGSPTVGEYLEREGYSPQFRDKFLIPMTAAIWSTPPDVTVTDFPAKTLVGFLHNHNLMRMAGKLSWLTFRGGSKKYVDSILSRLPAERLHLSTPVRAVTSGEDSGTLVTATGKRETFDHIIFACHTDDALRILDGGGGATPEEREILGAFRWSKNEVWLHSDESLMPRLRLAWSSWNYIKRTAYDEKGAVKAHDPHLSVTYWMNDIQRIPAEKHGYLFVTLNPPSSPSPEHVLGHYSYMHPLQTEDAVRAQRRVVQLNASATAKGRHRAFAGAWTGYGFHEHGFTAGLRAAAALPGVRLPFRIAEADVECGVPRAGVVARVFDVLNVLRAYVIFIIGGVLFLVVWPVGRR